MNLFRPLIVVFLFLCWADGPAHSAERRMNVLFLAIDDLNTWLLEDKNRYEGKVIAPNIRRLAKEGVLFKHAYAASPVCSPSRTAFLSGLPPWKTGVYENGLDIGKSNILEQAIALPTLFKEAGYSVASYGKIAHGWDFRKSCDDFIPHKRDPIPPEAPFLPFTKGEQDWGPTHLSESEMRDTRYADAAIRQLQARHEKPFFIACGLFHPHMPWYVPQKYFDLFPLDRVMTPQTLAGDLDDVPPLGRTITRGKSRFVSQVLEHGLHRDAVQAYLATTAYADAQIGRVIQALENTRFWENTIVVLLSDHGFHLGEKQHWQKATLWEEATHCLLTIRVPGMTNAGSVCQRFVSLLDLYPTLVELCGLARPPMVAGSSLVPLLKDSNHDWNSTAITAFGNRYVTYRDEAYRYIRYNDTQEELYDMRADPHQWRNLIEQFNDRDVINTLRSAVPDWTEMREPLSSKRKNR